MTNRTKILFKINNEVVVEENGELYLNQIDEMIWVISSELECSYDDIEVEVIELDRELSDFDVTYNGLINWKDTTGKILTGIELLLELGSDKHLETLSDGTLEDYLLIN